MKITPLHPFKFKLQLSCLLLFVLAMQNKAMAQRIAASGGTYTINNTGTNTGNNFVSFTDAINDLNTVGTFTGSVTIQVSAGQAFNELPPVITATGNSSAGISFVKSGTGANPVIVAAGTTSESDAGITINGGDYLTFNGIDITAADTALEFGYLIRKAANNNGARYNTITNATILMNRLKPNTVALLQTADQVITAQYAIAHNASVTYSGTPRATNSYNTYTNLTIGNSYNGIVLKAFADAGYRDTGNVVSNNSVGRSGMPDDIGSAAPETGIEVILMFWQYNAQTNGNILRNISLLNVPVGSLAIYGIRYSNSVLATISNNTITGFTATPASGNTSNQSCYGIQGTGITTFVISGNTISGFRSFGGLYGIQTATGSGVKVLNNTFSDLATTGGNTAAYGCSMGSSTNCRFSGNLLSDLSSSTSATSVFGCYMTGGSGDSIDNNVISAINTPGQFQAIQTGTSSTFRIYNNTIRDIMAGGTNVYGMNIAAPNNSYIYNNTVKNVKATGSSGTLYGISTTTLTNTAYIYNNTIGNIGFTVSHTGTLYGWYATNATSGSPNFRFYNNQIYGLTKVFTGAASATPYIQAIRLASTSPTGAVYNIYYNAVSIDASASPDVTSVVVFNSGNNATSSPQVILRNNIFANTTGAQAGVAKHYLLYGPTSGIFGKSTSSSDYNVWYLPNATNGFFGFSGSDRAALSDWKALANFSSWDANSITGDPYFNSPENLRVMPGSPALNAGTFLTGYTTDLLGVARHATAPTIGAYEQGRDETRPAISYSPILHKFDTLNYALPGFAIITDNANGGVNVNAGLAPRLYYKLKQHANAFAGNTPAGNGWKYVEAGNASSPFGFVIDYSLLFGGGVVHTGDTIQYFVVAQDTAQPAPNVQSQPYAGFAGTSVAAVTTAPSEPDFYTIFGTPASYAGTSVSQPALSRIGQGTSNNVILRVKITTGLTGTPAYVSRLDFNTNGSGDVAQNIAGASVYFTGKDSVFSASALLGSASFSGNTGSFSINGNVQTVNGDNFFWLVYHIRGGAVIGDSVDAELDSVVYFGTSYAYSGGATGGVRMIRAEYCASSPYQNTQEDIGQVTLQQDGSTILASPGSCTPTYNNPNATSQYTGNTHLPSVNIRQNTPVDFSVCKITSAATWGVSTYLLIYIDYNQNGIFDADETAYTSTAQNVLDTVLTGSFAVPCGALPGETRMRVMLISSANPITPNACINNSTQHYYGEIEDYTVNIIPAPVYHVSSTVIQQDTGVVAQGFVDAQMLRIPVKAAGCGEGILTAMYFNTGSSTAPASDIIAAKLYATGSSGTFNTGNLLGTVYTPAGAFSFTGLNDTLLTGPAEINNYWLVYDVSGAAATGNTLDAALDSIDVIGEVVQPAVPNPAGARKVDVALTFMGATAIQPNLSAAPAGSVNVQVAGLQVYASSTGAPVPFTAISVGTAGTNAGNIKNLRIWYTGNSATFSAGIQFGNTIAAPAATQTISGQQLLVNDTNYFWITYDLDAAAVPGDSIDAEITQIVINAGYHTPFIMSPAGSRKIIKAYCASGPLFPMLPAFESQYDDIGRVTLVQNSQTILDNGVSCSPAENNPNANGKYTDYTVSVPTINILQSTAVNFSVCAISSGSLFGSQLGIYIDLNQNGEWDAGEKVYTSSYGTTISPVFTGSFVIPCTALTGETRMRLVLGATSSLTGVSPSCDSSAGYNFGETEDYIINIIASPMAYVSSTAIQNADVIAPGYNDAPILRIPVKVSGCGTNGVSAFHFNTQGTNVTSNINSAKLYATGNSTVFNTNRLLGTVYYPAGAFSFTGISDTLLSGFSDTNNYWLAYDVSGGAAFGDSLDAVLDSIGLLGSFVRPLVADPAGARMVNFPMTYIGSEAVQPVTSAVAKGSVNNQVIGLKVVTSSSGSAINLTSVEVATTGTTSLGDIANLKVWYTGKKASLDTTLQFGSTVAVPSATQTLSQLLPLTNDTNYFWVTYDIAAGAATYNVVDAEITSVTIDGVPYIPSVTSPAGNRHIRAEYCASYPRALDTANGEDIGRFALVQGGITVLGNGSCTPLNNNPAANRSYSDFTGTIPAANLYKNVPVEFSLCPVRNGLGAWNSYVTVYVDFNQNGVWDAGEQVYTSSQTTSSSVPNITNFTGSFVIPCSAASGQTRMRVMLANINGSTAPGLANACTVNYMYGETEDYLITIQPSPAEYVSGSAMQITSSVAPAATNAPILRIPVKVKGCGTGTVNAFYFNTSGTTSASDIAAARLYTTGNAAVFNTGTLLGTVYSPSGQFAFTGLTDTLLAGATDTTNYWLAYDLVPGAQAGRSVDARIDSMELLGTYVIPAVTDPAGSRIIAVPMAYTGAAVAQPNVAKVETGTVNRNILNLQVMMSASGSPVDLTAIDVSTNGTTSLSDISNLKIWYTGTSSRFDTTLQFGATVAAPGMTQTISGLQSLANGTNHFWVTYDISPGATVNNLVDAEIAGFMVDGGYRLSAVPAPPGSRQIISPYCYSGAMNTINDDIGLFTVSDGVNTLLSNGSATPSTNNPGASRQYTSFVESVGAFTVAKGNTYQFSITPFFSASAFNSQRAVYIDYNNDGDFGDAGELVWNTSGTSGGTTSGSFTVPLHAVSGITRMRIILIQGSTPLPYPNPCVTYNYGETEDYAVKIEDASAPAVYTWNVSATSGDFSTAANWTPARSFPSLNDILVVGSGGNKTLSNVPVQQIRSLYVSNNTMVTLGGSSTLIIADTLSVEGGSRINSGSKTLVVGRDTANIGTLAGTGHYVGTMKRWVNTSAAAYQFPLMLGTSIRSVNLTFSAPPQVAGALTLSFVSGNPGSAGLPLLDTTQNLSITNVTQQGVWNLVAGEGLTGGEFNLTVTVNNMPGVNNYTQTALISRLSGVDPWKAPGTGAMPVGTNSSFTLSRSGLTEYGQFSVGGSSVNPLPVRLLSFAASPLKGDVLLTWSTAGETNSGVFVVERSTGNNEWETVQYVEARGYSSAVSNYALTDQHAFEKAAELFYRLKIIDRDGSFEYSRVISVRNDRQPLLVLAAYPNPLNGPVLNMEITSADEGTAVISILDVTGRNVHPGWSGQVRQGANMLSIDTEKLAGGVYMLSASLNGETRVIRLVKQ